ncbi:hypothetical protein AaE_000747 [Aphanomyces astaci]|uniref:Uncharacterized protein n=1 Tax=Aphanomyces astaci TaxID=112090 RepID=A0A6A5B0I7_APHAT|nr:hypothetical protein AaE_000747 [Aphanomyces astaci]
MSPGETTVWWRWVRGKARSSPALEDRARQAGAGGRRVQAQHHRRQHRGRSVVLAQDPALPGVGADQWPILQERVVGQWQICVCRARKNKVEGIWNSIKTSSPNWTQLNGGLRQVVVAHGRLVGLDPWNQLFTASTGTIKLQLILPPPIILSQISYDGQRVCGITTASTILRTAFDPSKPLDWYPVPGSNIAVVSVQGNNVFASTTDSTLLLNSTRPVTTVAPTTTLAPTTTVVPTTTLALTTTVAPTTILAPTTTAAPSPTLAPTDGEIRSKAFC